VPEPMKTEEGTRDDWKKKEEDILTKYKTAVLIFFKSSFLGWD
jgi:hypothetical protein